VAGRGRMRRLGLAENPRQTLDSRTPLPTANWPTDHGRSILHDAYAALDAGIDPYEFRLRAHLAAPAEFLQPLRHRRGRGLQRHLVALKTTPAAVRRLSRAGRHPARREPALAAITGVNGCRSPRRKTAAITGMLIGGSASWIARRCAALHDAGRSCRRAGDRRRRDRSSRSVWIRAISRAAGAQVAEIAVPRG